VIALYFGQLPPYFQLTLQSMAHNADVDWLLITDSTAPDLPPNVTRLQTTFADFCARIQKHFPFTVNIPRPYKIVDFRPAFGELLEEYVLEYDFWGHCDLDLLFGDIRRFLTEDITDNYDKLLMRGAFSMYRNTPEVNSWYRNSAFGVDYRDVFASPNTCAFDEWSGIYKILCGLHARNWDGDAVAFDIDIGHFRPRANYANTKRPIFSWDRGSLLERAKDGSVREGLYLHLQKRPMEPPPPSVLQAPAYYILGNRFSVGEPHTAIIKDALGAFRLKQSHLTKGKRK
jgi:hypothetical protein